MKNYQEHLDKVLKITRKLLGSEPKIIFEMGANNCEDTLEFAKKLPTAKIYTFECNPDTLLDCRQKIKGIENITLTEKAISDKEMPIKFFKTVTGGDVVNHGTSSVFETNKNVNNYTQEQIEVPATTIKNFCLKNDVTGIDLLWMDMQGSELNALKGAEDFIKKIKIINTEVEFILEYQNQPLFRDIKKFLNQNGFKLYTFSTMSKMAGDAIFINTNLIKRSVLLPEMIIFGYFRIHEKITGKIRKIKNDL